MMNKTILHKQRCQKGFSLIEALLALLILSIGLLGVAAMHMQGIRSSQVASQRMNVTIKTQEIIDRIQSNLVALNDYNVAAGSGADGLCNNAGVVCAPATMAAHDIFMMNRDLNALLPGAPLHTINVVGRVVTIAVSWKDRGVDHSYSVSIQV